MKKLSFALVSLGLLSQPALSQETKEDNVIDMSTISQCIELLDGVGVEGPAFQQVGRSLYFTSFTQGRDPILYTTNDGERFNHIAYRRSNKLKGYGTITTKEKTASPAYVTWGVVNDRKKSTAIKKIRLQGGEPKYLRSSPKGALALQKAINQAIRVRVSTNASQVSIPKGARPYMKDLLRVRRQCAQAFDSVLRGTSSKFLGLVQKFSDRMEITDLDNCALDLKKKITCPEGDYIFQAKPAAPSQKSRKKSRRKR